MNKLVITAVFATFLSATSWVFACPDTVSAARSKVEMCAGCHSIPEYRTAFPEVYRVPMLGGQNAKYIETALQQYKKGIRKSASMQAIAASLSDQDIAEIAAYYAAQKPTLKQHPKQ